MDSEEVFQRLAAGLVATYGFYTAYNTDIWNIGLVLGAILMIIGLYVALAQ